MLGGMYCLLVHFRLHDAAAAARFDALTDVVVAGVRAHEPGTLVYATHEPAGDPLTRVFYEVYADDDAFRAHGDAPHTVEFHARKAELLAGPEEVAVLTIGARAGLPQD